MLSRRGHRLSRFRKNKRRLRERLRQRIFFRDKVVPEAMEKPRVLVLTGAGISAESGIRTFRAADGLWEEHRVEDVATPEGFDRDPELVQTFYNARRRQLQQPEIQPNAAHLALAGAVPARFPGCESIHTPAPAAGTACAPEDLAVHCGPARTSSAGGWRYRSAFSAPW